jgi:AcrR family transcriptional regulator
MARPATNHATRKAEIIAAAIKSFAAFGYEGTSNKTIAQEGGFKSPALIYHYFPGGKSELFQACLEEFQPLNNFQQIIENELNLPLEIYLRRLAFGYLNLIQNETTRWLIKIFLTEAARFPELAEIMPRRMVPVIVLPILTYLGKSAEKGEVQIKQPLALVMQFFGPLVARTILQQIGIEKKFLPAPFPTDEELVDSVVGTFLHGILNETALQTLKQE